MPPEDEAKLRRELAALPLEELARRLAEIHIGDGDESGVLAAVTLARLEAGKKIGADAAD
jgi:hypothetical protein